MVFHYSCYTIQEVLERFRFSTNDKRLTVSDVCRCHLFTVNGWAEKYFRMTFVEDPQCQEWNTKEALFWQDTNLQVMLTLRMHR